MPDNAVIQKELPAIDLPVDKGAVLLVWKKQRPSRLPVDDLFHEIDHKSIAAFFQESEDRIQGGVRQEHVVCVAEHNIVRR